MNASRSGAAAGLLCLACAAVASVAPAEEKAPAALQACGKCHMLYPAEMLPQRSWRAIVSGSAGHFGARVDLTAKERADILSYLSAHAPDSPSATSNDRHFLSDLPSDPTPTRITETRWWRQLHADLDFQAASPGKRKSPADCRACHQNGFE